MPSNRKPLKKHRPRSLKNPLEYVLSGLKPIESKELLKIRILNHGALRSLTNGTATKKDWDYVCAYLNIMTVLAEAGLGSEYLDTVNSAMVAHAQCGKRLLSQGKFGYTGPELSLVNLALEVHEAQLEVITVAELEKAHVEVAKRLELGKIKHKVI